MATEKEAKFVLESIEGWFKSEVDSCEDHIDEIDRLLDGVVYDTHDKFASAYS